MYLSQFRLRVYHRSDKFNIVIDVFNRLFTVRNNSKNRKIDNLNLKTYHDEVNDFNEIETFVQNVLIEMTFAFRQQLLIDYQKNKI